MTVAALVESGSEAVPVPAAVTVLEADRAENMVAEVARCVLQEVAGYFLQVETVLAGE